MAGSAGSQTAGSHPAGFQVLEGDRPSKANSGIQVHSVPRFTGRPVGAFGL